MERKATLFTNYGKLLVRMLLAAIPLAMLGGCLQVETRILLHTDGSATVTERVTFSQRLLVLSSTAGKELNITDCLSKSAAEERGKHMGEGVALTSHRIEDAPQGARQSVAVFKVADINKFEYVSPFLAYSDYAEHTVLKASLFPIYEDTWYGRVGGQMAVTFKPTTKSAQRDPRKDENPPPPPSPVSLQVLRNLQPVFIDMMEGFKVRVVFESYGSLRFRQYYRYRGMRSGTHEFDLIDFSDSDLDNYSQSFLGNEEVMLELLRGKVHYPYVLDHTAGHGTNNTLPVYHPNGVPEIYFRPSREMFDKHFAGKTIKREERHGGEMPAKWEQIGWRGDGKDDKKKGEDE